MKNWLIIAAVLLAGWLLISRPLNRAQAAQHRGARFRRIGLLFSGRRRCRLVRMVGAGDALRRGMLRGRLCGGLFWLSIGR